MNRLQIILSTILVLVLIGRIHQIGGLSFYEEDPELENIAYQFEGIRTNLADQIEQLLPQPQAGLLSGIILGIKSSLPDDFKKALKVTSTMHIVVVSGQNLTLLAGLIMNIAYFLGRKKSLAITMAAVLFYSALTGLQTPVIRALIMVFFGFGAQFFNREAQSWWVLTLAALIMLIYQPNWIYSVSFQLSFLATIGVVVLAPELLKRLKFMPDIIRQDLGVTLAAQLMVLPIIASNFHQISLIGILVNSLILWTIPIILVSGIITLLAVVINPLLGQILALVPGVFLTYFTYLVNFFNTNWSSFYVGRTNFILWTGYYLLIFGIFSLIKKRNSMS